MKVLTKRIFALGISIGLVLPASVFATNGYFLIGYGTKARSMGGAGVAFAQDSLAAAADAARAVLDNGKALALFQAQQG